MKYISPFSLFEIKKEGDLTLDDIDYNKIRKRVLAKYELNDNSALEIKGHLVNKSEALNILEELKEGHSASFHVYVHNNNELKGFLENPSLDTLLAVRGFDSAAVEGRKRYLSKFFAVNFDELLSKAYKSKNRRVIRRLYVFKVDEFILNMDKDFCFGDTYTLFNKEINELELAYEAYESNSDNESTLNELLDKMMSKVTPVYIDVVNFLPDYFNLLKNRLAEVVYPASIALYNKGKREDGAKLIHILTGLEADHKLRKKIMKTRDEIMMH